MTSIYKAEECGGCPVPDLHLSITEHVPAFPAGTRWEDAANGFYRAQGRELVAALKRTLPGGTMHALLVALLEDKASLLRVRDPNVVEESSL